MKLKNEISIGCVQGEVTPKWKIQSVKLLGGSVALSNNFPLNSLNKFSMNQRI